MNQHGSEKIDGRRVLPLANTGVCFTVILAGLAGLTIVNGQTLITANTPATTAAAPAIATAATLKPKQPGIPRVGVVLPKAQLGQGNVGISAGEALRTTFVSYLSGPAIEVISITSLLPSQIDAESKQKECDYVLYSSVSQKASGGAFKALQRAAPFASMVPMVGMAGGAVGAVAGVAAGTAMSGAASLAGDVKAKAEITLEYRMVPPGSENPLLAERLKAKAKTDGEDVITPLFEQSAGAILAELTKKKS